MKKNKESPPPKSCHLFPLVLLFIDFLKTSRERPPPKPVTYFHWLCSLFISLRKPKGDLSHDIMYPLVSVSGCVCVYVSVAVALGLGSGALGPGFVVLGLKSKVLGLNRLRATYL